MEIRRESGERRKERKCHGDIERKKERENKSSLLFSGLYNDGQTTPRNNVYGGKCRGRGGRKAISPRPNLFTSEESKRLNSVRLYPEPFVVRSFTSNGQQR
jgi:hypothetical protein